MSTGILIKKDNLNDNVVIDYKVEFRGIDNRDNGGYDERVPVTTYTLSFKKGDYGYSRHIILQENGDLYLNVGYSQASGVCNVLDACGIVWEEIG